MTFPGPPDVEPPEYDQRPVFRPSNGWWSIIFIGIACWLIACACIWAGIWIAGGWR